MEKVSLKKKIISLAISALLFVTSASATICSFAETVSEMTPIEKINYYGGFENGISNDMSAANERVFRFFKFNTSLSTDKVHSGANSAKVIPSEDGAFFLFDVELEAGAKYDFSAFVYFEEGFEDGRIEISGGTTEKITNVKVKAGEWTEVKHTFTAAAAGKHRVAFTGFAKKDKVYYFDDIQFAVNNEMTPIEKINYYGGFENGISADMSAANDCVFRFFKFDADLSAEKNYSGNKSIKVVPTTNDSFFLFDLELEANTDYTFSTYVYSPIDDNAGNNIELSFYANQKFNMQGRLTGIKLPKENWKLISCSFKTGAAGKYRVAFKGFENGREYYFDDIKFKKGNVAGDVDGDGIGNTAEDILMLKKVLLETQNSLNTDVNEDGKVNICDLVSLYMTVNAKS